MQTGLATVPGMENFVNWEIQLPLRRLQQDILTCFGCNFGKKKTFSSFRKNKKQTAADLSTEEMGELLNLLKKKPHFLSDILGFHNPEFTYSTYLDLEAKNPVSQRSNLDEFFRNKLAVVFLAVQLNPNQTSPFLFHYDKREEKENAPMSQLPGVRIDSSTLKHILGFKYVKHFYKAEYANASTFLFLYLRSIYFEKWKFHIRSAIQQLVNKQKNSTWKFSFPSLVKNLRHMIGCAKEDNII